ncbi:GTPase IMAP family member 7-like [Parambassis ranga]|uniref:GTPase IMAP family member 8 n=1 Tax=Parambassis ranga TaxID=210632 RepID=A0A6P7KF78_9TELE|nr:GTPase IMAP family member 7-like [Parambassis ranga]
MSHKEKISVVLLGEVASLKKALITFITGKDLSNLHRENHLKKSTIYENDTYQFIYTPDMQKAQDDIQQLFCRTPQPDMCLLVVEEGFSSNDVWRQIEALSRKTGKPTEEIIVVLPSNQTTESYPFRCCTLVQLPTELQNLSDKHQGPNTARSESPRATEGKAAGKHAGPTLNLVLLGMAGTGKSASGNTILRSRHFASRPSSSSVTTECQAQTAEVGGRPVRVIDTPDIFDDDMKTSDRNKHVSKCRQLCGSDPCVYILVLHVSRFTDGERDILKKLERAFGKEVMRRTVLLFTRGNDLEQSQMSFQEFLSECQPDQKKIIEKCSNRCVLFENTNPDSQQVEELMSTVDGIR